MTAGDAPDAPLINPDLAPEYLRSLQDGLDDAERRIEEHRRRVQKLEDDREVLRARLAEARRRADLRRRLRDLLLGGRDAEGRSSGRPDKDPDRTGRSEDAADGVEGVAADGELRASLPVVGRLGPVRLPEPSPDSGLRIGLVADAFTTLALRYEACCELLRSDTGVEQLRAAPPDLLFVESAYSGSCGSWARRIARFGEPHPDLVRLVEAARELGVPTVFWNKEDPVNSDWFVSSMSLFDHLLTVDADMVEPYRRRFGHPRVHPLPFAAQPVVHHPPADPAERVGSILFAGSWFAKKHAQRRAQLTMLLDPARRHGLHILDRHAGDERFAWPERFRQHIVGSLPYPLAVEATRRYGVVVNVNTVTESPTMCARRVFELAAAATPIVSGPSRAMAEMMPTDAVRMVKDASEANEAYGELLADPAAAAAQGEAAREWVMSEHTWSHRLETVQQVVAGR